jgi:hypothetical protein
VREGAERGEQRLHAWVAEAERGRGPAVVVLGGQDDPLECGGVGRAGAGLQLRVEQALVDLVADPDERPPVVVAEQAADAEVVAVVDRRLRPERATLLPVLLDLRGAVVDVDPGLDAAVDHPGLEAAGRAAADPAAEDDRDVVGAAERQQVAERLLEPIGPACGRSKTRVSDSSSWRKASW